MACPIKAATIKVEDGCYVVKPTQTASEVLKLGKIEYDFATLEGAKAKASDLQSNLDDAYADAC